MLILNLGCGGASPLHRNIWFGDVRVDIRKSKNVTVVADAQHLPFNSCVFYKVFCFEVIEHLENPSQALREMKRVLKPNGEITVTIPNIWRIGRIIAWILFKNKALKPDTTSHRQGWDIYEFNRLLRQTGLRIKNIRWINYVNPTKKQRLIQKIIPVSELTKTHLLITAEKEKLNSKISKS